MPRHSKSWAGQVQGALGQSLGALTQIWEDGGSRRFFWAGPSRSMEGGSGTGEEEFQENGSLGHRRVWKMPKLRFSDYFTPFSGVRGKSHVNALIQAPSLR